MKKVSEELEIMEQLFRKYNNLARANSVVSLSALLNENEALFWEKVDSLDWWGGSGSMADYYLYNSSGTQSDHEKKKDNQRFRAALIAIYDGMVKFGRTNDRGKQWIDVFKQWQKQNI
jgi:hypothetical protein